MTAQPLTHHEILTLVEPFTRRGRHVDLAASDRLERRLVFKTIEHAAPGAADAMVRETLVLEQPKAERFRLTRRFPVAMTEDGYRRLKRFATEAGLDEGEALSFLFEHFDSVTDKDNLTHRLRLFNSELDDRKR